MGLKDPERSRFMPGCCRESADGAYDSSHTPGIIVLRQSKPRSLAGDDPVLLHPGQGPVQRFVCQAQSAREVIDRLLEPKQEI